MEEITQIDIDLLEESLNVDPEYGYGNSDRCHLCIFYENSCRRCVCSDLAYNHYMSASKEGYSCYYIIRAFRNLLKKDPRIIWEDIEFVKAVIRNEISILKKEIKGES